MIRDKKHETLSREDLQQLQIERLQSTLIRAYRNVAFYRQTFDRNGIDLEKVRSVEALQALPFTTKDDLRRAYPYDMFAVPLRDIVRIHATSGTTGQPIIVGYTRNDLENWTECTARLLAAADITEHDVVQVAFQYSLYTGGFGFHQGAERIGASVIPSPSTSSLDRQILVMRDFKTTALVSSPRLALNVAVALEEMKVHPEQLRLRVGLFGGEPWSDSLRSQLEEKLHIVALDNYGVTEIVGPGVAGECMHKRGLHINEDHFIAEVVNPETLEPVGPGVEGELVFTTITKEGFPVIRYRTGDISSIHEGDCPCGRTFARMKRVAGRTDDLIFFKGLKVFPSQIEEVILAVAGTPRRYQLVLETVGVDDTMEVKVELPPDVDSIDQLKTLEQLKGAIARGLQTKLDLEAKVTLAEPRSLEVDATSKAPRVIDRRGNR